MNKNNRFDNGSVKISNDIITKIASVAATEISGVHCLVGGNGEELMSPEKQGDKAVNIQVGRGTVAIDVRLCLNYDVKVQDTARLVQENVKKQVEVMTGLSVNNVNIEVAKIHY